jgi:hypothetical protein
LLIGFFKNLALYDGQKEKGKISFRKNEREIKICEEKELNKYHSFANRRLITEDKERQLKAIN